MNLPPGRDVRHQGPPHAKGVFFSCQPMSCWCWSHPASALPRFAAGESIGYHDHTWVTRSGRRLDVSWSSIRLPSLDERRLLLVSGNDVTERRHRELQLQHERFDTVINLEKVPGVCALADSISAWRRHGSLPSGGIA